MNEERTTRDQTERQSPGRRQTRPAAPVPASDQAQPADAPAGDIRPADAAASRFLPAPREGGVARAVRSADDPSFAATHPALYDFLTLTEDRGRPRDTATLLLFTEDGAWKWCLSDRQTNSVAFHACDEALKGLEAFEEALQRGVVRWRAKKPVPPRRG